MPHAKCWGAKLLNLAEAVRFELTDPFEPLVFKTSALNQAQPHFRNPNIWKHTASLFSRSPWNEFAPSAVCFHMVGVVGIEPNS